MNIISERTLALAGILQACHEVQSLAREGNSDEDTYESCMTSILVLDAVNTPAVYGGMSGIETGLKLLADGAMQSTSAKSMEILRYSMSIMQLQNQLFNDPARAQEFGREVESLSGFASNEFAEACSVIYQKYVSNMQPQVIVQGEEIHLQKSEIPPQIRALLLAALRSAVLWQQKGGGRFRLIWERTRMRNAAKSMLSEI